LRGRWGYDGILITDDFGMRAAYASKGGLQEAGVQALNAGIDLVLIAYDPDQYFATMSGLLRADRDGRLSVKSLEASGRRLDVAVPRPHDGAQVAR
jgi:beta-N-acetylhexosaminidase